MQTKIFTILSGGFSASNFIRVGENRNISLYIGKDECGRYSFDFRGKFNPSKTKSSDVICVSHIKSNDEYFLRFSLENSALLEYFCAFCEDLIYSTLAITDDESAYQTLRTHYYSWKQLFKPNHGNLTEIEVRGLIGELLFLKEKMIPERGIEKALESWTGPEKTHKDFSFEDAWYEIKTVSAGKETVHISSIEQLDSFVAGCLVIYSLEKMSPSYNGLKLNSIVKSLIESISSTQMKELFIAKLSLYGFDFSPDNDNYVYELNSVNMYKVKDDSFPRVKRDRMPDAITKVQYDIAISNIENFKIS